MSFSVGGIEIGFGFAILDEVVGFGVARVLPSLDILVPVVNAISFPITIVLPG